MREGQGRGGKTECVCVAGGVRVIAIWFVPVWRPETLTDGPVCLPLAALHAHATHPVMACAFSNHWAGPYRCVDLRQNLLTRRKSMASSVPPSSPLALSLSRALSLSSLFRVPTICGGREYCPKPHPPSAAHQSTAPKQSKSLQLA